MGGLHVVSGLHPHWTFEHYLGLLQAIHETFPQLYIKGFTGVEITHFAKISGLSVHDVLVKLKAAGLQAIAGGGAEILSDRGDSFLIARIPKSGIWICPIAGASYQVKF